MPRFLELLLVGLAGITLAAASADKACPTDQGAEPGVGSYVVHEDATIKVSECLPDVHPVYCATQCTFGAKTVAGNGTCRYGHHH